MEMDNNLLTAMVERWRKETHTFHLLEGEMTITLKDVAMLTELPIDGDAIIESSQKPLNGWGQFISERLGINIPEEAEEGRRVPPLHKSMLLIPWLVRTVGELPEDATDAQIERYARIYLICLVGGFLFPNKSGGNMHCMWLRVLLGDWDEIGRKSWGSACLAMIYSELCKCTDPKTKQAGGPMFILQLWVWEHLPTFAPICPANSWGPDEPLRQWAYGARWIGAITNGTSLDGYRQHLDRLEFNEVTF
ncbi:unnamed protein product [Linum tenue]|uniref:Aminotransferase-like plant mobile domain-containing protein n=1 Tax=Linum tenue TaxID=586396 RepID=A0AAV0L657_9ROSI|nr:unnamed protein product [Linum tenue]